jgi:DNA-binding CsgD family transcriptional regulator
MPNSKSSVDERVELIGSIFASAAGVTSVDETLRKMAEFLGSSGPQMIVLRPHTRTVLEAHHSGPHLNQANDDYVSYWAERDPKNPLILALPSLSVLRCSDHFDRAFVSKSEFFQDYYRPIGLRWALGGIFYSPDGTATIIANHRELDLPAFEDWTVEELRALMPQFQRASLIGQSVRRLQRMAEDAAVDIVQAMPCPAMLLGSNGRVEAINPVGLAKCASLGMVLHSFGVRFADAENQSRWAQMVRNVAESSIAVRIQVVDTVGRRCDIDAVPLKQMQTRSDSRDCRLLLVTMDISPSERPTPDAFAERFGLTVAERAVLSMLLHGHPAKRIASMRNSSVHTVRSQIASLLDKSGSQSQKELLSRFV